MQNCERVHFLYEELLKKNSFTPIPNTSTTRHWRDSTDLWFMCFWIQFILFSFIASFIANKNVIELFIPGIEVTNHVH
jgi:hypothetical protein